MFKGFAGGLKKVVKGGFSAVAEHTSQLAEQVVSDPSTSQGHLKESLKAKVANVVETGESVISSSEGPSHAKEKAAEVAHKVKHYGAFGEDYLGYSDPTKDLRKAVKQKEKAAKKARKEKKKRTGKKEDLFDPENLAKYKAELEEKRKQAAEAAAAAAADDEDQDQEQKSPDDEDEDGKEKPYLDVSPEQAEEEQGPLTPSKTPKQDTDDWQLFQQLTSGVDHIIQKKKEELQEIKQESYFQQKAAAAPAEDQEAEKAAKKRKKKKKKWVDLDAEGFEDYDGSVSGGSATDSEKGKEEEEESVAEAKDEGQLPNRGFAEVPEDDPFDQDEEEDLFNTDFVDAITSGEVKLAVIPDDPKYDDDEDDPFNTKFAEEIVQKEKASKRKEANRLKFTGLSSVADVLSGKADKVSKDLVDVTVKRKRRRANRINLIGEDQSEVTRVEDIGTCQGDGPDGPDILTSGSLQVEDAKELLATTPSSPKQIEAEKQQQHQAVDLAEFENLVKDDKQGHLTSNVAILAGEFSKPAEEQEDDFDAAFDALAQQSVTKQKLDQLEKQFGEDDVFDTSGVDRILNLASLAGKVEEDPNEGLEAFDDRDPFDTSAYEEITGELEAELGFETLASREGQTVITVTGAESDPLVDTSRGADAFGQVSAASTVEQGWAAFVDPKKPPKRPPPPKPSKPKPPRPPAQTLDPSNRPSVVVKAPSTESIKSWNCAVAENLIKKSELAALEAATQEEEEEEDDPFDTTKFVDDQEVDPEEDLDEDPFDTTKFVDREEEAKVSEAEEDPFDTSAVPDFEEEETRRRKAKDLLSGEDSAAPAEDVQSALVPVAATEADPFDTDFAKDVLPNKGDPFDTSFVPGGPGRAEIKALEEEFLTSREDEFDPREGSGRRSKKVIPSGSAGRARPHANKRNSSSLEIRVPQEEEGEEEEAEKDPFDTSIVDRVIPVRKARRSTELSVEDQDFDPTKSFEAVKEEIDPFDTSVATAVLPELKEQEEAKQAIDTPVQDLEDVDDDDDDDDFDPRG